MSLDLSRRSLLLGIVLAPLAMLALKIRNAIALPQAWTPLTIRWHGIEEMIVTGIDSRDRLFDRKVTGLNGVMACEGDFKWLAGLLFTTSGYPAGPSIGARNTAHVVISRMPLSGDAFAEKPLINLWSAPNGAVNWIAAPGQEIIV